MPSPLAVIDIGSNTGRAVILRMSKAGHLETLADGKAPLRLAHDVADGGALSQRALDRTVEVLRDFGALAAGSGASPMIAVATEAVRRASNGQDLIGRALRDAGVRLVIIDGQLEGRRSLYGALHGLPVEHGLFMDIGGGSIEVSQFRHRAFERSWTLPLGSLLVTERFLASDPPARREMDALRDHIVRALTDAGIPPLEAGGYLVGTGGTVRNLAKIDRHRRTYPIPRVHGYVLTRRRLQDLTELLASRPQKRRRAIAGLSDDRLDSIMGGALVAGTVAEVTGANEVLVAGLGLREGLAFDALNGSPPTPEQARDASVAALAARFTTWDADRAARRSSMAAAILEAVEPGAGASVRERLRHAATLLDIGRSIDYYRRFEHTADMLVSADLAGFSHRKVALLAAVVRGAGDPDLRVRFYRPLLGSDDQAPVARAGTILALADEIEHRLAPGARSAVACNADARRRTVTLEAPIHDPWRREALQARFGKAFRMKLVIQPDGGRERDA